MAASTQRGAVFTFLGCCLLAGFLLSGCNLRALRSQPQNPTPPPEEAQPLTTPQIETPAAPSLLTICMGQEPSSLFLYGDSSLAARNIRQAIYDGPIDVQGYEPVPVILENIPTLENGGISFEPITVQAGNLLVDAGGLVVELGEGVTYLPSGCSDFSCAVSYSGQEPVQVDQQVVRFRLRAGISWSDGSPLKADDSQFSFEVAKGLYPRSRPDLLQRTQSYLALDEQTVEWRGLPGYRYSGYAASFFTPLPRHAWGALPAQDLLSADVSNRSPLGWGPFKIENWTLGDHISLVRSENYFRSAEGLPHFERLVFRFTSSPEEAIAALKAGECDVLDETNALYPLRSQLLEAQTAGELALLEGPAASWEHLDFGIDTLNPALTPFFKTREARQAVAMCIDRQAIADQLYPGQANVPNSFVMPDHSLVNPDVRRYSFDPQAAGEVLDSIGWLDDDGNPETPRRALGVPEVADGTSFELSLDTLDTPESRLAADAMRSTLAQCGIGLAVNPLPGEQLFASGAEGLIFGRRFNLVQFGWMGAWQPPCFLYTTQEIPGTYPQNPKGWGGSNPGGYSNLDFDRACQRAQAALPEEPGYRAAHLLAQSIFTEDLPALPLYQHTRRLVQKPGLCGASLDPSADSALWNLENFTFGEDCSP